MNNNIIIIIIIKITGLWLTIFIIGECSHRPKLCAISSNLQDINNCRIGRCNPSTGNCEFISQNTGDCDATAKNEIKLIFSSVQQVYLLLIYLLYY